MERTNKNILYENGDKRYKFEQWTDGSVYMYFYEGKFLKHMDGSLSNLDEVYAAAQAMLTYCKDNGYIPDA
jgi:hypothetical protein